MNFDNLLGGPPATLLPPDAAAPPLAAGDDPEDVARQHPASSLAWAVMAEQALAADHDLYAYAFARVGYHRGLDALRRNGWKGYGPVPWSHEPNQGFLRSVTALALASQRIGDDAEATRCAALVADCDPAAPRSPGAAAP